MYLLKKNLRDYFKEIDINQNVVIVDVASSSMLFDTQEEVIKFRKVLLDDYNYSFKIIQI
jgi:hypothetical protein